MTIRVRTELVCDSCGQWIPGYEEIFRPGRRPRSNAAEARRVGRLRGWVIRLRDGVYDRDLCGACR